MLDLYQRTSAHSGTDDDWLSEWTSWGALEAETGFEFFFPRAFEQSGTLIDRIRQSHSCGGWHIVTQERRHRTQDTGHRRLLTSFAIDAHRLIFEGVGNHLKYWKEDFSVWSLPPWDSGFVELFEIPEYLIHSPANRTDSKFELPNIQSGVLQRTISMQKESITIFYGKLEPMKMIQVWKLLKVTNSVWLATHCYSLNKRLVHPIMKVAQIKTSGTLLWVLIKWLLACVASVCSCWHGIHPFLSTYTEVSPAWTALTDVRWLLAPQESAAGGNPGNFPPWENFSFSASIFLFCLRFSNFPFIVSFF